MGNQVVLRVDCGDPAHRIGRVVVRDGFIGKAPRRRQRFRCRAVSSSGDFHRFVPPVPRFESLDHRCLDCESDLDVSHGPNAPRRYDYVAREVAAALVALARGATYQEAAFTARTTVAAQYATIGRALPWNHSGMRHGQAAADWAAVFTHVVLADCEETEWPGVVLCDSTSFWRRGGGTKAVAFHVLMAYGYDVYEESYDPFDLEQYASDDEDEAEFLQGVAEFDRDSVVPQQRATSHGRLLLAQVHRKSDAVSWAQFLQALPGRPEVIVADRAGEIRRAAADVWPSTPERVGPEFVNCRWHLLQNVREVIAKDLATLDTSSDTDRVKLDRARSHELYNVAALAFDDTSTYRQLMELIRVTIDFALLAKTDNDAFSETTKWLKTNELPVTIQQLRRPERPGPESTGPLEAEVAAMRNRLTRRAQVLRNQPRTNTLLRLLVAGRRGQVNERLWAELIRAHLEHLDGVPAPQRRLAERRGASSL